MEAQSGRSNENVVISVGSLCSLRVELREACLSMPQSYCIFKTPTILFRHKETSFLPNCFSIGPMHHGKRNFLATEKIKVKYLKALLSRVIRSGYETMSEQSKEIEEQNVLSDWIDSVEMIKKEASSCYAGRDFAAELGDEFVKTMLLDGVFVIELFRKDAEVIILGVTIPRNSKKNESSWQPIRSITRLKEAGVKFVKAVPEPDSVLDIRFRDGCLTIPSLLIQETTETIFRNLIAYEQCLPKCQPIFTCYAKLLDNLIDTTNDMEILCKREIFDNWLSPDDATQFFNNLYNDAFVKEFYYAELCNKLDRHCKRMWPQWRAYYVQNYFSKPWAIAAQIYAVVISMYDHLWEIHRPISITCLRHLVSKKGLLRFKLLGALPM
ncbi:hypothetical protein Goshw_026872 [Gossypium schwendimanii]|uniref:Uncharacterized protein n=1 Tax=Gossypium schwendimanii TaxID=34291 RepID=A0A7J9LIE9_GOSSC|nr:hypothetical protein [Gossypium schwendimanii]